MSPPEPQPTVLNPWPAAAGRLAARVSRRGRLEAAFLAAGPWLGVGALSAAALRAAGAGLAPAAAALVAGLSLGILRAVLAAQRAPRVEPADAAWALDRLGSLGEAGLAAAGGTVSPPLVVPPLPALPRLLPPRGAAFVVGSALVGALALLAPDPAREKADGDALPAAPAPEDEAATGGGATPGTATDGAPTSPPGRAPLDRARDALNLPPEAPLEPKDLVGRLSDPADRARVAAALAGTAVAERLGGVDTAPEAAAGALLDAQARWAAETAAARRAAAAAEEARGHVPPARRELVARYLARRPR